MRSMPEDDPLARYGPPLAGVICALVLSVLASAIVASHIGDAYQTRALVYAGFVLWVVLGAVVVFVVAHRGEAGRLSIMRVLLWAASIWLWPAFVLLRSRRNAKQ